MVRWSMKERSRGAGPGLVCCLRARARNMPAWAGHSTPARPASGGLLNRPKRRWADRLEVPWGR